MKPDTDQILADINEQLEIWLCMVDARITVSEAREEAPEDSYARGRLEGYAQAIGLTLDELLYDAGIEDDKLVSHALEALRNWQKNPRHQHGPEGYITKKQKAAANVLRAAREWVGVPDDRKPEWLIAAVRHYEDLIKATRRKPKATA